MGHHYEHLGALERNFIQRELNLKSSRSQIALALGRSVRRFAERSGAIGRQIRAMGGLVACMMRRGPARGRRSGGGAGLCGLPQAALCANMCSARYARAGRRSRFRAG